MRSRKWTIPAAMLVALAGHAMASEPANSAPAAGDPASAPADASGLPSSHNCITATGTHIPPKEGSCVMASPGRVITRDEIEKSGATSVGDALNRLTSY
jgi:hypothetical protein